MVGVVLLLLTLAYGLTGYLLPWDNRAYWGTVVTTQIAGQAPVLGPYLSRLLGGEGAVGVVTLESGRIEQMGHGVSLGRWRAGKPMIGRRQRRRHRTNG